MTIFLVIAGLLSAQENPPLVKAASHGFKSISAGGV